MVFWILKGDGTKEPFKVNKIKRTAMRAGASPKLASAVVREVARVVHEGMTSREILRIILRMLREEEPSTACRYDLKGAIMRLGTAGFNFEQLMSEILKEYGYASQTNQIVKGFCVSHEIDIVAKRDGETVMIECKYHHEPGAFTGLKETMYTWARLQDLQHAAAAKKAQMYDAAWLVTNTKFSSDSIAYGTCQGVRLVGWNIPKEGSLRSMIEDRGLYPVTVLPLDEDILLKLGKNQLLLLRDLKRFGTADLARILGVGESRVKKIQELAMRICKIV